MPARGTVLYPGTLTGTSYVAHVMLMIKSLERSSIASDDSRIDHHCALVS